MRLKQYETICFLKKLTEIAEDKTSFRNGGGGELLILEYKIAQLFSDIEKLANSLYSTIKIKEFDFDEAQLRITIIDSKFAKLERLLPSLNTDRVAAFKRHMGFVKGYLYKNLAPNNLKEVIEIDIPGIKQAYYEKLQEFSYLDPDLRTACENLLVACEFDSAIRKAFLVLKKRAMQKFGVPAELDGEALVNYLFSLDRGKIRVASDNAKQLAFRNYCSGLFGFFRNIFAHNLVDNPEYVTETILSTINMLLKLMDRFSVKVQ